MVSGVNVSTCYWESRKGFIWDQLRFSRAYPVYTRLFARLAFILNNSTKLRFLSRLVNLL
jgi:hypothetical protein